jgi:prepilin-type N-terminal cleavage/methylation domain-containing protein
MRRRELHKESGFTLLEVLVALTVMAVGAAVVISLLSGSLGNIRKSQLRTKIIEQAQTQLERALLDDTVISGTTQNGTLEDGTSWAVAVEEPDVLLYTDREITSSLPVTMLQFTIEMRSPDSQIYTLQTLKVANKSTSTSTSTSTTASQ